MIMNCGDLYENRTNPFAMCSMSATHETHEHLLSGIRKIEIVILLFECIFEFFQNLFQCSSSCES